MPHRRKKIFVNYYFVTEIIQITNRLLWKDLCKITLWFYTVMRYPMTSKFGCGQTLLQMLLTSQGQRSSFVSKVPVSSFNVRLSVSKILNNYCRSLFSRWINFLSSGPCHSLTSTPCTQNLFLRPHLNVSSVYVLVIYDVRSLISPSLSSLFFFKALIFFQTKDTSILQFPMKHYKVRADIHYFKISLLFYIFLIPIVIFFFFIETS